MKTEFSGVRRIIIPTIGILILLFIVMAVCGWIWIKDQILPVKSEFERISVVIPKNSTTADIAELLYEKGVIKNEMLFKIYARFTGMDRKFKAGEYLLSPSASMPQIAEELVRGNVIEVSFTVPEGFTVKQIAQLLSQKGIVNESEFLKLIEKGNFNFPYLNDLPEGKNRLEGFLFPDTYRIPIHYKEKDIIQMMLDRFIEVFDGDFREKAEKLGITPVEAVTLASIIEREVKIAEERRIVSAVFHNRLEKGMLLQSCATVQYALGETKEVLLFEDLKIQSPYNTYLHKGLPPGPIASPGREALEAAVNPADVDYLYFVAKEDGSHHFSRTLQEHNAAVRKYRK